MIGELLKVLGAGLSLWEHKEKHKYIDRLEKARRQYEEEYNKPLSERSDAVLDNIRFELRLLSDSFAASVAGAKNS